MYEGFSLWYFSLIWAEFLRTGSIFTALCHLHTSKENMFLFLWTRYKCSGTPKRLRGILCYFRHDQMLMSRSSKIVTSVELPLAILWHEFIIIVVNMQNSWTSFHNMGSIFLDISIGLFFFPAEFWLFLKKGNVQSGRDQPVFWNSS